MTYSSISRIFFSSSRSGWQCAFWLLRQRLIARHAGDTSRSSFRVLHARFLKPFPAPKLDVVFIRQRRAGNVQFQFGISLTVSSCRLRLRRLHYRRVGSRRSSMSVTLTFTTSIARTNSSLHISQHTKAEQKVIPPLPDSSACPGAQHSLSPTA